MSIKDAYTSNDLSPLLGMTDRAVRDRAKREGWQARPRVGKGGGNEWLVSSMPEKTRLELATRLVAVPVPAAVSPARQAGLAKAVALNGKPRSRVEARVAVLLLARIFVANAGLARIPALDMFSAKWNAGEVEAEAEVRAALPKVCRNSLMNWEKQVATAGVSRLGGTYGQHRKGKGCIDGQVEVRDLVLGMIMDYPDTSSQLIHEGLETLNGEREKKDWSALTLPSLRRLQEWMKQWKQDNIQLFQYIKAPDKWRSLFLASCGNAYELLTRYNQLWEYDGTPADLLLADGKRYTIVGVINVFSRELKFEVAQTSSARVVANLTRRALLDWGVPEEAVTDNGKEFVSSHMQQLLVALDILPIILPPFRPELKPAIERAFRIFSHHLLTLYPCYVGHNVATRQEIRERRTFAKQLFQKEAQLSMALTPEELQVFCDQWTDKVYRHRKHSGLKGKTPFEVHQEWAGEIRHTADERALDILLTPLVSKNGRRHVSKKGVGARSGLYDHAALGPLRGEFVQVRIDPADLDHAYIFEESGEFVCKAVCVSSLKIEERKALAMDVKRVQRAYVNAGAKVLRKSAAQADTANIGSRILAHHVARADEIEAAAQNKETLAYAVEHVTEALEQASVAARTDDSKAPLAHSESIQAAREAGRVAMAPQDTGWQPPSSPGAQAKEYGRLYNMVLNGEFITEEQRSWMYVFEQSQLFDGFAMIRGWQRLAHAVGQ